MNISNRKKIGRCNQFFFNKKYSRPFIESDEGHNKKVNKRCLKIGALAYSVNRHFFILRGLSMAKFFLKIEL